MKYKRLYLRLNEEQIHKAAQRYHFEENGNFFQKIYKKVVRSLSPVLYYEYNYPIKGQTVVIISLGKGIDTWLDFFQKEGKFLEAYAVECLGLELLSCAYEQLDTIFYREQRQFVRKRQFCDAEQLVTIVQKLEKRWPEFPVQINSAGTLLPSKSVLFYAQLGKTPSCHKEECQTCSHKSCVFRTSTGENYDT